MIAPIPTSMTAALDRRTARELVELLARHAVLLDADGTVWAVNQAWRNYAESQGVTPAGAGASYQSLCNLPRCRWAPSTGRFHTGLEAVLAGSTRSHECYDQLAIGGEPRLFRRRITRLEDGRGPYYLVTHEDLGTLEALAG